MEIFDSFAVLNKFTCVKVEFNCKLLNGIKIFKKILTDSDQCTGKMNKYQIRYIMRRKAVLKFYRLILFYFTVINIFFIL